MSTPTNLQPTVVVSEAGDSPLVATSAGGKSTYGQILKSSALIGGSSAFNTGLGMVRTKVMAVLLGQDGVGLFGLYGSIMEVALNFAGMGINTSGVRQIAEAHGSGDKERIGRIAVVLRRISVILGMLGALSVVLLCWRISFWTFGSGQYAAPVALLSLAVLFRMISDGQGALIQGMRRISDLARIAVMGGILGTGITLVLIYLFRERGIVPSLIGVAVMTLVTSWWYRRKIEIPAVLVTAPQMRQETSALLKLGFAFMASGVMTAGAAYVVRIIVIRHAGLDALGSYQSAWALGGQYIGFILQAMGSDFYPRLTAVANRNDECNRLVNEQAQIGLLLAGPGVIATLTFAPLVIVLFYSSAFASAVEPLRWICLGLMLRVIAWPMGYIVLAKNKQKIFVWTELAAVLVQVGLTWAFVSKFGLVGAGIGFFGLYVWHGLLIYWIVRNLCGFRWSVANKRLGLIFLPLTGLVLLGFYVLPFWAATSVGVVSAILSGIYSIRGLLKLIPAERIPLSIRRFLVWFSGAK